MEEEFRYRGKGFGSGASSTGIVTLIGSFT